MDPSNSISGRRVVRAYLAAIALAGAGTAAAFALEDLIPHASLSLVFLVAVLIAASYGGLGPSLLSSLASFLSFNFFFTTPYYTLEVGDDADLNTLLLFFLVAAITGHLAARMHREVEERRAAVSNMTHLNLFARRLSALSGSDAVLRALADSLAKTRGGGAFVCLAQASGGIGATATAGTIDVPDREALEAGLFAPDGPTVADPRYSSFPVNSDRLRAIALVAPAIGDDAGRELVRGMCDQASVVLERTLLEADLERARVVTETEQLRSALLSSVSHDLRTPLASIIGSTTSLLEYGDTITPENRLDLLRTVVAEARRLDRYIQNLLDMTRLGHGSLDLKRDWVDPVDIVSSAIQRIRTGGAEPAIETRIEAHLPLLWVHGALVEQALFNLIDNAVKFAPDHPPIIVTARREGETVVFEVIDHGPGIAPEERERIFDMFFTQGSGGSDRHQGTGLGLAICRGLIAAHGGTVNAVDTPNATGVCMRIRLPLTGRSS